MILDDIFIANHSVLYVFITAAAVDSASVSLDVQKTFHERYSLSKDLGSGAFSVVKLAIDKVFVYQNDVF